MLNIIETLSFAYIFVFVGLCIFVSSIKFIFKILNYKKNNKKDKNNFSEYLNDYKCPECHNGYVLIDKYDLFMNLMIHNFINAGISINIIEYNKNKYCHICKNDLQKNLKSIKKENPKWQHI